MRAANLPPSSLYCPSFLVEGKRHNGQLSFEWNALIWIEHYSIWALQPISTVSNDSFFQVILLLALSKQFGSHPSDLPFCLFAQTFVFVAYNKVVTSQYFLWYLSLLPLVFPARIRLTRSEMATLLLLWGFTQASWLLPAYFLEFKG